MENKVAIITGSSRGIGAGIARKLSQDGYSVVINYVSNEEAAKSVLADCPNGMIYKADVSDFKQCEAMVEAVLEKYGQIDALVNNSGITRDTLMLKMTNDDFCDVIDKNLVSAFNMTKCVTKAMFKKRTGRIINISSVIGISGNAGQANYAASKAGLIGFTKSIAKEYGARNITCNAVAPGFIKTDMTNALSEQQTENIVKSMSLSRLGEANDVAALVSFLVSEGAGYITGQVIAVDGGLIL